MTRVEQYVVYTCDHCGHSAMISSSRSPNGWCTLDEDHHSSYCPACNPHLVFVKEANPEKLRAIELKKSTDQWIAK